MANNSNFKKLHNQKTSGRLAGLHREILWIIDSSDLFYQRYQFYKIVDLSKKRKQ